MLDPGITTVRVRTSSMHMGGGREGRRSGGKSGAVNDEHSESVGRGKGRAGGGHTKRFKKGSHAVLTLQNIIKL